MTVTYAACRRFDQKPNCVEWAAPLLTASAAFL